MTDSPRRTLVLGTRNEKKKRELKILLASSGIQLKNLNDFENSIEVDETGETFGENAQLKAVQQAQELGQWVLGEDSGLVVDALSGAPGVYSARFAGEPSDDEQNNAKLINMLQGMPLETRTAHYVCHTSLADPAGNVVIDGEAICRGRILLEPRGGAGFGYDPLFEIPEYRQTFAELGDAVKSVLSHRARAIRQFSAALRFLIAQDGWPLEGTWS